MIGVSVLMAAGCSREEKIVDPVGSTHYVSPAGDDANDGSVARPWATISRVNLLDTEPGDTILFQGGSEFKGQLQLDSADAGSAAHSVFISSYGKGKAILNGGNASAIVVAGTRFIKLVNITVKGAGRKEGNTESGIVISHSENIVADSISAYGFQKSGIAITSSSSCALFQIHAHDNGAAGISVGGNKDRLDNHHISIRNCLAENNPGDPTNFDNQSGNGIVVGMATDVLVEYCVATNNGWDMPRVGNGPIGIWTYESDSVRIRRCISYRNKTSAKADDGGGFDLDGGVTNSVIEFCLSYENQGAGYGLFQYEGASPWRNNTVRFCISENDGTVSRARAGVFVWNADGREDNFSDLKFHNNLIINSTGSAMHFDTRSKRRNFVYFNNILISSRQLVNGSLGGDLFLGNDWWSTSSRFQMGSYRDMKVWAKSTGYETKFGILRGMNVNPELVLAGPNLTNPLELISSDRYATSSAKTRLHTGGIDIRTDYGFDPGNLDFNGKPLKAKGVGPSFE